jgi:fumarylacetoacetase
MTDRLLSWLETANVLDTPFPLNNLPCGVFSDAKGGRRCGIAIGDSILDVPMLESMGQLRDMPDVFGRPSWNAFMACGPEVWRAFRARLIDLLSKEKGCPEQVMPALVPLKDAVLYMPFDVAEYTDFYASYDHSLNVGTILRGANDAIPENWLHIPMGYNGRASTVVVSGTPVQRPLGQIRTKGSDMPILAPSRRLDFELELGAVVGVPNGHGRPVTVAEADDMIFGYVLLNDWSARDIQAWEYRPLGPFQSKGFATTISPWIVTRDALAPARCAGPERRGPLLPYLNEPEPMYYDIKLSVSLCPAHESVATDIVHTNYRRMYYSLPQQLCHHAINGCAMRTGDLLGSGTISGPSREERGCMLELAWNGDEPIHLSNGVTRSFLEDGDVVNFRGAAYFESYQIGFGECKGQIMPTIEWSRFN